MARTRFEWTMITLSFLAGGWVTWEALRPLATGGSDSHAGERSGSVEARDEHTANPAQNAPTPEELATSPGPVDDEPAASAPPATPSRGEQLQQSAVERLRRLKDQATNSQWKKDLTESVGGTAEMWWSGVREALGAGPKRPPSDASPVTNPVTKEPPKPPQPAAGAPESQPASPLPPAAGGAGTGGQLGAHGRQNGGRQSSGWLRRLLQAL